MTGNRNIEAVRTLLWPAEEADRTQVYAILDGARDPRIEYFLSLLGLRHECLLGSVGTELRNCAPFIVNVDHKNREFEEIFELISENGSGIFVITPKSFSFEQVFRQFKKATLVIDENKEIMFFRYYDPVVFEQFICIASNEQIIELFGCAIRFVVDSPSAGSEGWFSHERDSLF